MLSTTSGASTYYKRTPGGATISERGAGGEFYYVTDGLGATVALVDTTGALAATYTYDPAGKTAASPTGPVDPLIAGGAGAIGCASGVASALDNYKHLGAFMSLLRNRVLTAPLAFLVMAPIMIHIFTPAYQIVAAAIDVLLALAVSYLLAKIARPK